MPAVLNQVNCIRIENEYFYPLPPIIGQPQYIPITVRPAAVFPLDVYFLMDFSESMYADLTTLQSIAGDIGMCIGLEVLHNSSLTLWAVIVTSLVLSGL